MRVKIVDIQSSLADSIFPKYYLVFSPADKDGVTQDIARRVSISSKQFDELIDNHGYDCKGEFIELSKGFLRHINAGG